MSNQLNEIDILFRRRTELIGRIAEKNAQHLRILQLSSGMEILLMRDNCSPDVRQEKSDTDTRIANSLVDISELQADLAIIDEQIETALEKET